jgi:hypothetical protein
MKNLIFALAFMLVGTFSFANENINSNVNKIDNYSQTEFTQNHNQLIVINSLDELKLISEQLSNMKNSCEVSFTFSISVGVFSASGTISGTCQDAQNFFDWIYSFFQ